MELIREISEKQLEWRNHPSTRLYVRENQILSKKNQEDWLKRIHEDKTIEMFGILVEDENVGTCGLTSIDYIHSRAEYSMLIGPEYRGRGYAVEALKMLTDYGFKNLHLHKIWGEIFSSNASGLHIAKKAGYIQEATIKEMYFKEGEWIDVVRVGVLESEWNY